MLHNARHEPLPRKPDPEPARLRKRKRVTIIAAFQCTDGLLMCADSEQTLSSESKSQMRKIFISGHSFGKVAIGAAGDGSLIDYVQQRLHRNLTHNHPTLETFEGWLVNEAYQIFELYVQPYGAFPDGYIPEMEMLIGLQMNGQHRLYKWERNFVYPIPLTSHTSIGIGTLQSEHLISQYPYHLTGRETLLYAVRIMLRVKQLVQGCGGKTEVAFLGDDGIRTTLPTSYIDAIEYLVEDMDGSLFGQGIGFISTPSSPGLDEVMLNTLIDHLKHYKAKYEEIFPGWGDVMLRNLEMK